MLIRFSIENYRSFKDQQIFTMAASHKKIFPSHFCNICGHDILKSSAFFGPNASGKSNLIYAINFMRHIVLTGKANAKTTRDKNFRLDKDYVKKPGIFQVEIIEDNHCYNYGFAINYSDEIFENEWLYEIFLTDKNKQDVCIFKRDTALKENQIVSDLPFDKDTFDKKRYEVYSSDIPSNRLFLSEVAKKRIDKDSLFQHFKRVFRWFLRLIVIYPQSHAIDINKYFLNNDDQNLSLKDMLYEFDTGIEDLTSKEKRLDEAINFLPNEIQEMLKKDFYQKDDIQKTLKEGRKVSINIAKRYFTLFMKNNEIYAKEVMMDHGNHDDTFELFDESEGTQRLFDLIPAYQLLRENRIVFIDEIDRSFHNLLTQKYIQKYYELTLGKKCQLIYTTHNIELMSSNLLRADEVWFVERQSNHSSKLYSLSDFRNRNGENVLKEYLLGRFGAVPVFGEGNGE